MEQQQKQRPPALSQWLAARDRLLGDEPLPTDKKGNPQEVPAQVIAGLHALVMRQFDLAPNEEIVDFAAAAVEERNPKDLKNDETPLD